MLATGLLLALATSPTPAVPSPVELRWDAPAGCPAQAELDRQVAALLAGHPPADPRTRVAFRVERRGPQWQLHGEIHGAQASGRRDLSAATCDELVEAAALIVAIAVDPDFVPGEPAVPPPPPPAESTLPDPNTPQSLTDPNTPQSLPDSPPPQSLPDSNTPQSLTDSNTRQSLPESRPPAPLTASAPRRPALVLGLSAGLGLGALPAPAGLLRLIVGLEGRLWSAAVVQDLWLPRVAYLPATATTPPATYGGRFWLWSAGLRGCVLAPLGRRLSLPVCGTLAAGVHAGTGVGAVTHARRQVSPWLGLAVGPGLQLRVSPRVRLGLALELLGILARPDLRIAGRGTVCCGASLGAQLTLGVAVVLPGRRR